MACLPDEKILAYLDNEIKPIEQALIRDHLLVCTVCRRKADRYAELNRILAEPPVAEPPAWLVSRVMKRLYPEIPRYTSIAALIAASFAFFITWIYIYFDFSSSSLIQALQLTADKTSGWLVSTIKAISAVYTSVQAVFKAGNALVAMLLNVRSGATVTVAFLLGFSGLLLYAVTRRLLKKQKEGPR
ncbi:MAG TPA: zf-HC2 domain-containing protein [Candidatus Binatia bacterium]|nr:zf-HC2 domain-containing protein [Candidatus Binatia bacterium]